MQLGLKMKDLTDCGSVSDQDVCKLLFALAGFVEETANVYFENFVSGQGKGSAMCSYQLCTLSERGSATSEIDRSSYMSIEPI